MANSTFRKPSSRLLNDLYSAYCADSSRQDELLQVVFDRAFWVLQDDDAAQEFTIGVYGRLPINGNSFSAWLRAMLHYAQLSLYRRKAKSRRETNASSIDIGHGDDGEMLTNDEKLDILNFRHTRSEVSQVDRALIEVPLIRRVLEMLEAGHTQQEIAEAVGISYGALRERLRYWKENYKVS